MLVGTFHFYMLRRHGFKEKWQTLIMHCLATIWFSIMINGMSNGFFNSSRDLRQGKPSFLPPFCDCY